MSHTSARGVLRRIAGRGACRPDRSGDDGAGLILVIGTSVMVAALVTTGVTISVNALSQSRNRQQFEQSLAAAEHGIDWGLARVQGAYDDFAADHPVPGPDAVQDADACDSAVVGYPAGAPGGVFPSEAAEKAWARTALEAVAAVPGCLLRTGEGEVAVLKPPTPLPPGQVVGYGTVYALAWVPSRAASEAAPRLLKNEYVFMPYAPTHAVLTGGPLEISSSTTVQGAAGVDPLQASVHSNATVSTNGNPTATGPVSSSGVSTGSSNKFTANPGGGAVTPGADVQAVPKVSARSLYRQAPSKDPAAVNGFWYDLCPGGVVRPHASRGGSPTPLEPCTATTQLGTATSTSDWGGWLYDAASRTWKATRDALPGVWYAHEADVEAKSGGSATFSDFTVIASAQQPDDCAAKRYGSITWNHHALAAPAFDGLWMFADTDIVTGSNFTAGSGTTTPPVVSGLFVAGDQMELTTSSAGAVGAVVASGQCPSPPPQGLITENVVRNPTVWFDPSATSPFSSVVTTALWLDYSG